MSYADRKIFKPHEGFQEQFVRSNVDFVVGGGSMGGGKENPLYTKVLTPNGWVRMGDLKVGDLVCTPFGTPSHILQIFEHKNKDIYRVHTLDGKAADCGLEHLWLTRSETQLGSYKKNKDVTKNKNIENTKSIIEKLNRNLPIYIPNCNAVEFATKDFVIPPYVLGVMIGDGCIVESAWEKTKNRFMITSMDVDVINRCANLTSAKNITFAKKGSSNYIYSPFSKDYYEYLHSIGFTVKSYDKFIPIEYLFGDINQRKELLSGLFDTDGTIDKRCSYSYSTSSEKLKDDIIYLCRSLGYKASFSKRYRKEHTKGYEYIISIQTNDIIFLSEKHQKRYDEFSKNQYKSNKFKRANDHSRIKSIEKVGVCDTRCIWIDDPLHLYIIDDFMVTHNTTGAVLAIAEPSLDPKFRAVFLRNNLGDLKSGGGILDEFKNVYGKGCNVIESGDPHVDFPSGARIDVTHIADQSKEKVLQRFKGRQYDFIYFDEGTGFTWDAFTAIYSRNRGTAKWTGKVRMTTNPKRSHWLRTFLDWYIGVDGFIIPERNGVVRYFYINGETVKDVVWGDSKEQVYQQCKIQIDRTLAKFNGKTGTSTYEDMIKSFTFYLGTMAENKAILGNNSGYVGSVAVMGGREAQANLEGNWNVDTDENFDAPIPSDIANQVFLNDDQRNGDKWVTCDLADTGTDNFLCIAWDGFHIIDILILGQTTPRQNAERLEMFAAQHNISNTHIIYDAIRGTYINDYIPEAIPYFSYAHTMGMYGRMADKLKDECYLRLVEMIKRGGLSIDDRVATKIYEHQKLKENITIQNEFLEECAVVRFKEVANGKKKLLSKKEMNQKLGRGRSMDLLDPCAMRMMPILELPYGEELLGTMKQEEEYDDDYSDYNNNSVYNDSMWC